MACLDWVRPYPGSRVADQYGGRPVVLKRGTKNGTNFAGGRVDCTSIQEGTIRHTGVINYVTFST
eukprot:23688-Rhodomonas_salina.1